MAIATDNPTEQATLLVRYIEIWAPTEDGEALQLSASRTIATGATPADLGTTVRPGEGVAGRAWNQRSATVLQEEPSELLAMLSERCGTPLAAVLAVPIFDRTDIRGVVVLGLGDGNGAVEVWSRDERDELSLSSSWHNGLDGFEFISRYVRFPKGAGIPGEVWKARKPLLVRDPGNNPRFMRSFTHDPANLTTAIGLPIGSETGFAGSVLLLLPCASMPLAREVELWDIKSARAEDQSVTVNIQAVHSVEPAEESAQTDWRTTVLGAVAEAACPMVVAGGVDSSGKADTCLAVPIFRDGALITVWALLF